MRSSLTLVSKSKVAELNISKDADLLDFCRMDQVEEHWIFFFSIWLQTPPVLVTFYTETESRWL